jgi:hypothetical protein
MSAKHLVAYAIILLALLLLAGAPLFRTRLKRRRKPRHERIDLLGTRSEPPEP